MLDKANGTWPQSQSYTASPVAECAVTMLTDSACVHAHLHAVWQGSNAGTVVWLG